MKAPPGEVPRSRLVWTRETRVHCLAPKWLTVSLSKALKYGVDITRSPNVLDFQEQLLDESAQAANIRLKALGPPNSLPAHE